VNRSSLAAAAALATLLSSSACTKELTCPAGARACADACVDTSVDPAHCGACGVACPTGEACRAGACTDCASACGAGQRCERGLCVADVYVACFATDEVRGATASLEPAGAPRAVGDGPVSLYWSGDALWVAHALGAPVVQALVPGAAPAGFALPAGGDLEYLRVRDGRVYVSNSTVNTITVLDAATGAVLDEVSLAASPGDFVNVRGIDFVGSRAYVALPGDSAAPSFAVAQAVAVVDFSSTPARVVRRISMDLPGAHDAEAFPFPYRVAVAGGKVYVTLANLRKGAPPFDGFYTAPAGNGRLAVVDDSLVDTRPAEAVSIVDLGPQCQNPVGLTLEGTTLWVSCGSGAVLPVLTGTTPPTLGAALATPAGVVPGNVAACRGAGYVTDQFSGKVIRFDTAARSVTGTADVCPVDPVAGFAFAADVACVP
jgi:YVTN family beta-propeller protein